MDSGKKKPKKDISNSQKQSQSDGSNHATKPNPNSATQAVVQRGHITNYFKSVSANDSNKSRDLAESGTEAIGAGGVGQEKDPGQGEGGEAAVGDKEECASEPAVCDKEFAAYAEYVARCQSGNQAKSTRCIIADSFLQIPAASRTMDQVTKSVYAEQVTDAPKPLILRELLKRLNDAGTSDEVARKMAEEYIDQRIFAANVKIPLGDGVGRVGARTLGKKVMCGIMAMLQWILYTWLPAMDKANIVHTPDVRQAIRRSVLDLICSQNSSHAIGVHGVAKRARTSSAARRLGTPQADNCSSDTDMACTAEPVAQASAPMVQRNSPNMDLACTAVPVEQASALMVQRKSSERCFRCIREFRETGTPVWSCSGTVVVADGSSVHIPCNRTFCADCILARPPYDQAPRAGFCCPVHQQRPPATGSGLFPRGSGCFYCPQRAVRAPYERSVRYCRFCGKALCPQCGVFEESLLRCTSRAYTCPGCLGAREDAERIKGVLLGYLFTITKRKVTSVEQYSTRDFQTHRLSDSMATVTAFADFLYDAWRAGWHDVADPFVEKLMMMNFHLHSSGRPVVTTASQCLRMLRPSPASRLAIDMIGRANARELVLRHRSGGFDGFDANVTALATTKCPAEADSRDKRDTACWPEWIDTPSLRDEETGPPRLAIWMHDAALCSLTTSLSAYLLAELAKSTKFSSVVLFSRRLSADCDYDEHDGPVKMLMEGFRGRLKLFEVTDSDDVIYAWLVAERFHIILDMTGASNGKIDGVLSRPRTAVQVAYLGYPGPAYGIWDYTITSPGLVNIQVRNSKRRGAFLMTGSMYPPVGRHNGHTGQDGSQDAFDMPEEGRPILAFLGSTDKIDRTSVFSWCEMLVGTGDGPNSAILMLIDGPETNVRAIDRWRIEYNEGRSGPGKYEEIIPPSRIFWFPY